MLYNRVVSRPDKGLLILYFVVPKWCPTLQNHAVTGYAALFVGFEKTPISCGFAGSAYGATCHLMAAKTAIQTIKKAYPPLGGKYAFSATTAQKRFRIFHPAKRPCLKIVIFPKTTEYKPCKKYLLWFPPRLKCESKS